MNYKHTNKDGMRYATKGEFRDHMWNLHKNLPADIYREPGESFDQWFQTLMECMLEDGSAKAVGNHYEVYEF